MSLASVFGGMALANSGLSSGIVNYNKAGDLLTLAVKIADTPEGRVITFEDITRQLLDQRQAAWSDVARRIAHEIKNPLTPIQLATERLKRRYRKQIEIDGERNVTQRSSGSSFLLQRSPRSHFNGHA